MLVLSRLRDETIKIGDDIEVTVVDIRGDKVRLGINAPREIGVHRQEVYDAIQRENRATKPAETPRPAECGPVPKRTRPAKPKTCGRCGSEGHCECPELG